MSKKKLVSKRLPRTFHATFIPERQYIAEILRYAAAGNEGTYQDIRNATGIPMGEQSGKAQAILDYCRGMGLVVLGGKLREAVKRPRLTAFGRRVFLEDPYLKEPISQWVAHLNLCSPLTGADLWYHSFCQATPVLGMRFKREKLDDYLKLTYTNRRSGLIGPLLRTYEDEAALLRCGAVRVENGEVVRKAAPLEPEFAFAYGAWLLQLMADHFPDADQVALGELEERAGWRTIPGWDASQAQRALVLQENKGMMEVDRNMSPWLLRARSSSQEAWTKLYDDLV